MLQHDMAVLPGPGCLFEAPFLNNLSRNRLFVGHLRFTDVGGNLELVEQPVYDYLQVKLAHPRDNLLTGVFIGFDRKGRVLQCDLVERLDQLLFLRLAPGLDGHPDNRVREIHCSPAQ
jgi:hypothetical protein